MRLLQQLLVPVMVSSLHAASITVEAVNPYGINDSYTVSVPNVTATTEFTRSNSFTDNVSANRYGSYSYTVRVSPGSIGGAIAGVGVCSSFATDGCGTQGFTSSVTMSVFDVLHINGPASGFLSFEMLLEGSLDLQAQVPGNQSADIGFVLKNNLASQIASLTLACRASGCTATENISAPATGTFNGPQATPAPVTNAVSNSATIVVPYSNGTFGFQQQLFWNIYCLGNTNSGCSVNLDFLHSALLGGVQVLDSNLNAVSGAIITSDSGFDYAAPLSSTAAVPEPGTLVLMGGGLLTLAAFRRR